MNIYGSYCLQWQGDLILDQADDESVGLIIPQIVTFFLLIILNYI